MRKLIPALLFTVFSFSAISAQTNELHKLGDKGYKLVLDMQFEEANIVFDELIRLEPENASGYLLKSLSYNSELNIKGIDDELGKKFQDIAFKAVNVAEMMLEKNEDDIDALFFLGCAYGNIGVYFGNTNSWLKAYWYARKGKNYLEKVIQKDPEYYDAYLGLGMYHYYAGVLPKVIKVFSFLLGVEGDREKGFDEIMLAASKGSITRDEAKKFLAESIYFNEHNYTAALPLFNELTAEYPENHFLQMRLATCYRILKKYTLSVRTIKKSLGSKILNAYPYLHSQLYYNLGRAYIDMNKYDQAIAAFKKATKISQTIRGKISWVYAWSLFYTGDSYKMMGKIDKARENYSQIRKKDDENAFKKAQMRIKNL